MAIYHYQASVVSRNSGKSACATAAYCSGESITCERTGETYDYRRKGGVDYSEILIPKIENLETVIDRAALWNLVEATEKRKDSQLARSLVLALPTELNNQEKIALVKDFANKNFVGRGMIADINIHHISSSNPHAHILLTMRELEENEGKISFGKKDRSWNEKALLKDQRESWGSLTNEYLANNGIDNRIDHRSYADQGIEQIPQIHIGVAASAMEKRGISTERGDKHRQITRDNLQIAALRGKIFVIVEDINKISNEPEEELINIYEEPIDSQIIKEYQSVKLDNLREWYQQAVIIGRDHKHLARIAEIGQALRDWQSDNSVGWDKIQALNLNNIQHQMTIDQSEYQRYINQQKNAQKSFDEGR
jgi:MobA/MobL family